jgi:hypothetical protein
MSRNRYIPWAPEEEENLPAWLSRHEHLPWGEIREEYVRQFGLPRSIHSLRGKSDQLQKGQRRQRPISQRASELHHLAARRARHREQRHLVVLPVSPPPLNLKRPDPRVRQLLRQMQQLDITRDYTSAEKPPREEDLQSLPSQHWSKSGEPDDLSMLYWHETSVTVLTALLTKQGNIPPTSRRTTRPMLRNGSGRFIITSREEMTGGGEEQIKGALEDIA